MITDTKRKLATKFEMKDLGMMHYFLGMEMWQNADGISLGQGKYAVEILKSFGMMDYVRSCFCFSSFNNFIYVLKLVFTFYS